MVHCERKNTVIVAVAGSENIVADMLSRPLALVYGPTICGWHTDSAHLYRAGQLGRTGEQLQSSWLHLKEVNPYKTCLSGVT